MKATILNHPNMVIEEYDDKIIATYSSPDHGLRKNDNVVTMFPNTPIRGINLVNMLILDKKTTCRQVKWNSDYIVWEFKEAQ